MTKITLHPAVESLSQELADDLAKIEEAVTTRYSLADALREGSTKGKQHHGGWVSPDGSSVCALSQAAAAVRARGLA